MLKQHTIDNNNITSVIPQENVSSICGLLLQISTSSFIMTDPQKSKQQPIQVEMEGNKIYMILPTMEDNILMGIK